MRINETSLRRLVRQALIAEGGMGYPVDMPDEEAPSDLANLTDAQLRALAASSAAGSDTQIEAQRELDRREKGRGGSPRP